MTINHGYKILKKYSIDEILIKISTDKTIPDEIIYNSSDLKDSIKRVEIIKELLLRDGFNCKGCNISSSHFAMGKDNAERWHLDLYGLDSNQNEHMFTIDHIHPKSKGGKNIIENYQLLCKVCNEKKGNKTEDDIKIIDKISIKNTYLEKRISSITDQIKSFHRKLKNKKIVCIKEQKGFTVGNEYKIIDIKIRVNRKNNVNFQFVCMDDNNEKILSSFDNFVTKVDYIKIKRL